MKRKDIPPEDPSAKVATKCHLLDLPAELRNHIYELSFTENKEEVDLLEVQSPSKSLLLTCRQAYNEAKLVHRSAYRNFWSTTKLTLTMSSGLLSDGEGKALDCTSVPGWLEEMGPADISGIKSLVVRNLKAETVCVYRGGVWSFWECFSDSTDRTDPEMWSLEWQELWILPEKSEELLRAGFTAGSTRTPWVRGIPLLDASVEERGGAMATFGRKGLSKADIMNAMWE